MVVPLSADAITRLPSPRPLRKRRGGLCLLHQCGQLWAPLLGGGFLLPKRHANRSAAIIRREDDKAMPKLQLSFACGLYDRMQPLYTGEVQPDGIDLNFIAIDQPRPIFDRMSGGQEFDVAEYSASEFTQRFTRNECPFVAIPVFPSIAFRMGFIAINKKSGIKTPKDLEGKRIGVPLYTMTAAIFINGILHHEFGVDLTTVRWMQSAMNEAGAHGSPTVLPLLKRMSIENNQSGKTLGQLLAAGELDATLGTSLPEEIRTDPNIVRLFPNFVDVDKDLYKRKGIYPIMHLVAIKKSVYERYPFVATSLYDAFVKSKKIALQKLFNLRAVRYMTPFLMREIDDIWEVFNGDPWPYGVEPNRRTLEALITYQRSLGLTDRAVKVDDLFVPTFG
jgi:4,5-dihydroxyphthalate decarboxylase